VRNNNSSRFGKLLNIFFDDKGAITAANFDSYLLEKSRIVQVAASERSYHIFYQLLAGLGPDHRQALGLNKAAAFHYLAQSGTTEIPGVSDAESFQSVQRALDALFPQDLIISFWRLLAGILHLGNITFAPIADSEGCECTSPGPLGLRYFALTTVPSCWA
jgi:myosin heavy subunit